MFGIWHRKRLKSGSAWSVMVPDFTTSTDEFYSQIREAIAEKRVPDVHISEVQFREGGLLSAKRRYLRIRREYHVFDVCSAPYGTSWFFSCRFGEYPMSMRIWEVAVIVAAVSCLLWVHGAVLGWVWGPAVFALNFISILYLLNTLAASELYGLDAVLMRLPVVGALYQIFLRGDSYHRSDTRTMYFGTVDHIIREAVRKAAGSRPEGAGQFKEEAIESDSWLRRKVRSALAAIG